MRMLTFKQFVKYGRKDYVEIPKKRKIHSFHKRLNRQNILLILLASESFSTFLSGWCEKSVACWNFIIS